MKGSDIMKKKINNPFYIDDRVLSDMTEEEEKEYWEERGVTEERLNSEEGKFYAKLIEAFDKYLNKEQASNQ